MISTRIGVDHVDTPRNSRLNFAESLRLISFAFNHSDRKFHEIFNKILASLVSKSLKSYEIEEFILSFNKKQSSWRQIFIEEAFS